MLGISFAPDAVSGVPVAARLKWREDQDSTCAGAGAAGAGAAGAGVMGYAVSFTAGRGATGRERNHGAQLQTRGAGMEGWYSGEKQGAGGMVSLVH